MSYGYLVITSKYCHYLRENCFPLDDEKNNVYFSFSGAPGIYRVVNENDDAMIDKEGEDFLKEIYKRNDGIFIFCYTLLKNREGSLDVADRIFKLLRKDLIPVIYVQEGEKLELNQPYIIEIDKNKKEKYIYRQIYEKWGIDLTGDYVY